MSSRQFLAGGASRRTSTLLICSIAVGLVGGYGLRQLASDNATDVNLVVTSAVTHGPFDHVIIEQGELESGENDYVVCEVKSRGKQGTRILWVIEDGSDVRQGELLVQLDSSALEEELTAQRVVVGNAQAEMIQARAETKTAEIAISQYLEGTYVSERKIFLSEIARAQQALRAANLSLRTVRRLAQKGAIDELQIESANFEVANSSNVLGDAERRLRVLENLTREKNRVMLESGHGAADAHRLTKEIVLREQMDRLREIEDQIAKCSIHAPTDGIVIYNNITGKRATTEWVVEPGAFVRERQVILKMPDLDRMRVKAHINETQILFVREGQAAKVTVDAIPGADMMGRVETVKKWAKKDKYGTYVREFACYIDILDPSPQIQVGMTAEVQILADHLPNAVLAPVNSVLDNQGRLFCLRKGGQQLYETIEVEIGATNDTMAVVRSGLAAGDEVVLMPHRHLGMFQLPDVSSVPDRDVYKEIRSVASPRHSDARPADLVVVDPDVAEESAKPAKQKRSRRGKARQSGDLEPADP